MASEGKEKPEKAKKPAAEKKPAEGGKEKKAKPEEAPAAEAAPAAEKKPAAPRPPADPRLKVLKKFEGRFLPKGPLRERHKALMTRWKSGEDHGGVTVEELKSLLDDWRKSRQKTAKA